MSAHPKFVIEALSDKHNRRVFSCGVANLDAYLQRQSRQDERRGISRVYVAIEAAFDGADDAPISGYYTLSGLSVSINEFAPSLARKLPKHPIPAVLLGRLAVAHSCQGLGIGQLLLADALQRVKKLSAQMGLYAVVVDALDEKASGFYQRFGFLPMMLSNRRLFLRILEGP